MASEVSTQSSDQAHGQTVAKHYNDLKEAGLAERTKSRIFYLRNFNNWIKSMVISEHLALLRKDSAEKKRVSVLDLCSGKGGDLLKWKKGDINKLICADIASTSVEQSEDRYKEMQDRNRRERYPSDMFTAQFISADCTKTRLKDLYKDPDTEFDLVSCQFSYHYSFESYHQADMMLRNACECLRVGGYFIGTTPNSNELLKRLRAEDCDDMSFGNEVYRVTFNMADKDKTPSLYGEKYDFHLEGVVDCPEFIVYFPALEKMAEKYGMKLVKRTPFAEYFAEQVVPNDGRGLIGRMQGLEPYPAEDDVTLMSSNDEDYAHVKQKLEDHSASAQADGGDRGHKPLKLGTLSKAEWQAATVYLVFAFQKVEDVTKPFDASAHACTEQLSDSDKMAPADNETPAESGEWIPNQSQKRTLEDNVDEQVDSDQSPSKKPKTT